MTTSPDTTIRVWNVGTSQTTLLLKAHDAPVTGLSLHPTGDYLLSSSLDQHWAFSDIRTGRLLTKVCFQNNSKIIILCILCLRKILNINFSISSELSLKEARGICLKVAGQAGQPLTTAQFHPDGLIFGTGTADSQVKIWDLKEQSNVANFPGHTGPITAISFSENGYYLATAAEDSCVKLWDLRKLKNFKTLQLEEGYEVKDICFDQSGTYLAVAGTDVR